MLNISPCWKKKTVFMLALTTALVGFLLVTLLCPFSSRLLSVSVAPLFPFPSTYPGVPQLTDLSFQDVSDTTISLRWSPLNTTAITGYRITVVAAGESVPIFQDFVLPTVGDYTVYGLEPGIDYDISVVTLTENGESEPITHTQQTSKIHVSK